MVNIKGAGHSVIYLAVCTAVGSCPGRWWGSGRLCQYFDLFLGINFADLVNGAGRILNGMSPCRLVVHWLFVIISVLEALLLPLLFFLPFDMVLMLNLFEQPYMMSGCRCIPCESST